MFPHCFFFVPKNIFSGYRVKEGQINNRSESGVKGCVCTY